MNYLEIIKEKIVDKNLNGLPIKFIVTNNENYKEFEKELGNWSYWIFNILENKEDNTVEVSTVVWWDKWNKIYDIIKDLEIVEIK